MTHGSGKSVTSKSIMQILQSPPAKVQGKIFLEDTDLLKLTESEMRLYIGNKLAMIFKERSTKLILITDRATAPFSQYADELVVVDVVSLSFFNSNICSYFSAGINMHQTYSKIG